MLYAEENDGQTPPAYWYKPGADGTWQTILRNSGHITGKEITHCPSVDHYISTWYHYGQRHTTDAPLEYRVPLPAGYINWYAIYLFKVEDTANYFHLGDSANLPRFPKQWFLTRKSGGSPTGNDSICLRHDDVANLWFVDGHVESCNEVRLDALGFTYILDGNGNEL